MQEVLASGPASATSNLDCVDCLARRHSAQQHSHQSSYQSMLTPPDENVDYDWSATPPSQVALDTAMPSIPLAKSYDGSSDVPFASGLPNDQEDDASTHAHEQARASDPAPGADSTSGTPKGDGVDEEAYEECIPGRPWLEDALAVLGGSPILLPRMTVPH